MIMYCFISLSDVRVSADEALGPITHYSIVIGSAETLFAISLCFIVDRNQSLLFQGPIRDKCHVWRRTF